MKYGDTITYIRKGGNSRNGKLPDRLETALFVRAEGAVITLRYSESSEVFQCNLDNVVLVSGVPFTGACTCCASCTSKGSSCNSATP